VDLAPNGSGTTLTYAGTARLEGPIAIADNPLTRPLAHKAVDQFFENLGKQIS
jgi:carbon monoxide dehydrogenase subunit G